MTPDDVEKMVYAIGSSFDPKDIGNIVYPVIADELRQILETDREAIVGCLRRWLLHRRRPELRTSDDAGAESNQDLAMYLAGELKLTELRPDLVSLLEAVRKRETPRAIYVDDVQRSIEALDES